MAVTALKSLGDIVETRKNFKLLAINLGALSDQPISFGMTSALSSSIQLFNPVGLAE